MGSNFLLLEKEPDSKTWEIKSYLLSSSSKNQVDRMNGGSISSHHASARAGLFVKIWPLDSPPPTSTIVSKPQADSESSA